MDTNEFDEVMIEFIAESREGLDQLDIELVELEQHADADVIARIFRAIHTIKGTSGFLGLSALESLTHAGENLLSRLRDGDLTVTSQNTSALLTMVDAVRRILASVERDGTEGNADDHELVEWLERETDPVVATVHTLHIVEPSTTSTPTQAGDDAAGAVDETPRLFGEVLLDEHLATRQQVDDALSRQLAGDPRHIGELLVEQAAISSTAVADVLLEQADDRPASVDSIRVDVRLLDDLMNLVGELVLARNQILQFTQGQSDPTLVATSQRLNLITTELQEGVMRTRMQPIENVWNKFPRVVRDLTLSCAKQARLEMEGKHTELDKTLLEAIKAPLTHLVRNAIDHGLESPEARRAAGKPAEGVVRLRAYHEGGQVIIEIGDDGAGIDPALIRRKAVQKGLLSADEAAARSDRDIVNLIFAPGFSTAEQVSNISGRGVGMDVVKTNIEGIGGSVDVHTARGTGTTFKVKIPLTLAIIPALLVTCGAGQYAIPQVSLLELVRLDGDAFVNGVERINGVPVHRLRGRLLPLVFLDGVFGEGRPLDERDAINIVVVQADDHEFGLVVDDINDTAEIVVKPLGKLLKHVSAFAGATIMGDGRVALILDVLGIAGHVGIGGTHGGTGAHATDTAAAAAVATKRRLLVFGLADRRLGLPLEAVARLEEFDSQHIESSNGRPVVQYRGEIMPLVDLAGELDLPDRRLHGGPMQVVVYTDHARSVGLVVDQIFDIVEESFELMPESAGHGILGCAIIQGAVTDVIDVRGVLDRALPGLAVATTVALDEEVAA